MSSSKTSLAGLESRSARTLKSGSASPQLFVSDRLLILDPSTRLVFWAAAYRGQICLVPGAGTKVDGDILRRYGFLWLDVGLGGRIIGKRRLSADFVDLLIIRSLVAVLRCNRGALLRLSQLMASVLITRGLESADGLFFHRMIRGCRELCFVGSFGPMVRGEVNDLELVVEFRLIVFLFREGLVDFQAALAS